MKALIVLVPLLLFFNSNAQLSNLDFEQWHMDSTSNPKLDAWRHFTNDHDFTKYGAMLGTWKDTIAQHGTYALTLSRWYASDYDHVLQTAAAPGSAPAFLNGYYIYKDPNLVTSLGPGGVVVKDSAVVSIALTKWNITAQKRDTIGYGMTKLTEIGHYTGFSVPISYSSQASADSVTVSIVPTIVTQGNVPACHDGGSCSYLTIDNLELSMSSIVSTIALKNTFKLYPSPCYDVLNMDCEKSTPVSVVSYDGVVINKYILKKGINTIDVRQLASGVYFIVIDGNKSYRFLKL